MKLTFAYIPSRFLAEFRFLAGSSSSLQLSPTDNRDWLPSDELLRDDVTVKPSTTALDVRFSRDTCRLLAVLLLAAANCDSKTEATEFRLDGGATDPLLDVFDVLWWWAADGLPVVEFFGVGGNGELACRFSGFGDPRLPTELVQDDEEATKKWLLWYDEIVYI